MQSIIPYNRPDPAEFGKLLTEPLAQYLCLLLQLDDTVAKYGNDSAEANAIRGQMDAPWYKMSSAEGDLANEIAARIP